jgi:hypothetical protein
MTKFTLVCDHSCDLDTHVVTHQFNAEYLPDVLLNIEQFLRGVGYHFDGVLTIEEPHSEHYYDTERNR